MRLFLPAGPILPPLLQGLKRELYWETGKHADLGRGSWTALRRGGWKYVQSPLDGEFLFDVAADPGEKENLAESRPEVFAELRERRNALAKTYREP